MTSRTRSDCTEWFDAFPPDDVEAAEKPAPEIDITVDREAVAVADKEPGRGIRVAVSAQTQYPAVRALDRDFGQRTHVEMSAQTAE